tara:strand:+ start:303 stop:614 length:312 start_codon:yes stop_codon:yes gene_type:complete
MKKIVVFILIFFLILSTSIIKNSTKDMDDKIYSIKENLIFLENRIKDSKLEYNYLSSSEKLSLYQKLYFEKTLNKKLLNDISSISILNNELIINNLTILDKNE